MDRLKGKVALISGGARGQGSAEAQLFAAEGAFVVVGDILDIEGKETVRRINESGGYAKYVHLDVTSRVVWDSAVLETIDSFGKIDVLVNNAGITLNRTVSETTVDEWDKVNEINGKGVFIGLKCCIPAMLNSGGGSIINISSIFFYIGLILFCVIIASTNLVDVVDSFKDKGKVIVIDATINVERESQKVIVLGKKGIAIQSVGTAARKTLQNFFKKKIFLGLFVKVSKDWRSRKSQLKKFGYN